MFFDSLYFDKKLKKMDYGKGSGATEIYSFVNYDMDRFIKAAKHFISQPYIETFQTNFIRFYFNMNFKDLTKIKNNIERHKIFYSRYSRFFEMMTLIFNDPNNSQVRVQIQSAVMKMNDMIYEELGSYNPNDNKLFLSKLDGIEPRSYADFTPANRTIFLAMNPSRRNNVGTTKQSLCSVCEIIGFPNLFNDGAIRLY
jgi:hypothetical protein